MDCRQGRRPLRGKTLEVPFTDLGRKLWEERTSTPRAHDPNLQCKPSGLPRAAGTQYPLQIIQLPKEVMFLYEGGLHTFRKVPIDGRTVSSSTSRNLPAAEPGHKALHGDY